MAAPKQTPSAEKSLVIQKRLEGKSMNQIVKETGISKGKVQYLIKDWTDKMGSSVDEITDFTHIVKKSGITIEQCAEGFRMINILKELGVEASDIADGDKQDNDNYNNNDGLIFFIKEIYNNCKKLDIPPAIITSWIKDLLDFQTFVNIDKTDGQQDQYKVPLQGFYIQRKEQQNLNEINTPIDITEEAEFNSLIGNKKSGPDIEHPTSAFNFNQTKGSSFSS
ncbi:MAG: hypothetical protein ACTHKF_10225 [Candidatus Nitrosocosmicus sp.]